MHVKPHNVCTDVVVTLRSYGELVESYFWLFPLPRVVSA